MKFFGKLVAVLISVVSASAAYAGTISMLDIDVDPSMGGFQTSRIVQLGNTFTVDIHISSVSGLYAYDIDVDHDPGILDATSVTEGSFLTAGGSTFFLGDDSSNPVNAIATLLSVSTGVSGSGTLFSIQYMALAAGVSPLQFTFTDLVDDQLNSITAGLGNASITVQAPLPSTLLMLGAGLAAIAGLRRRAR